MIDIIIIGYQGIGKSTLAKEHRGYIDLESGNFWHDGKRPQYWYAIYGNIAKSLHEQGYKVLLSSHEVVRRYLKKICDIDDLLVICPSLELKDKWIEKLEKRYEETGLEKDYRAMMNGKYKYDENIKELMESGICVNLIKDMEYNLKEIVDNDFSHDVFVF